MRETKETRNTRETGYTRTTTHYEGHTEKGYYENNATTTHYNGHTVTYGTVTEYGEDRNYVHVDGRKNYRGN